MRRTMMVALAALLTLSECRVIQEATGNAPDAATVSDAAESATAAAPTGIDAIADVTITSCLPGDYGTFNPQLSIVNASTPPAHTL